MSQRRTRAKHRLIRLGAATVIAAAASAISHGSAEGAPVQESLAQAAAVSQPKTTTSPAAGRVLGGLTSQQSPVILDISKNSKRIDKAVTDLELNCTSGDQFWIPDSWSRSPLDSRGSASVHLTIPPDTSGGSNGVTVTGGSDTFSGKLNRKTATFSGSWQLQLTFSMSDGTTDQCDSGLVTFEAKL
jgi:hypothetical protein